MLFRCGVRAIAGVFLLQVLGNFASLEEQPKDGVDTVAMVQCTRGGIQSIHSVMRDFPMNSTILQASLDALCNVCNDPDAVLVLAESQDIVQTVISVIQSHDWDEQLVEHAIPLITNLTSAPECAAGVIAMGGIQVLLSAMDTHGSNKDLLANAQVSTLRRRGAVVAVLRVPTAVGALACRLL